MPFHPAFVSLAVTGLRQSPDLYFAFYWVEIGPSLVGIGQSLSQLPFVFFFWEVICQNQSRVSSELALLAVTVENQVNVFP